MTITRAGSQPLTKRPTKYLTGRVGLDQPFQAEEPGRASGATVTFEPGARTAWHTHPLGQTLLVVSGVGWVQREGQSIQEIHPGDHVWSGPGEKHWRGATPTTAMSHIAVAEKLNGKAVEWMEQVSEAEYAK